MILILFKIASKQCTIICSARFLCKVDYWKGTKWWTTGTKNLSIVMYFNIDLHVRTQMWKNANDVDVIQNTCLIARHLRHRPLSRFVKTSHRHCYQLISKIICRHMFMVYVYRHGWGFSVQDNSANICSFSH
jgi:hypothetical protein